MIGPWVSLCIAGVLEAAWTISLKRSEGFTKLGPSLLTLVIISVGLICLSVALRKLPVTVCYPVFIGIGALAVVSTSVAFFGEHINITRVVCMTAIILGTLGLRITTP